MLRKTVFFIFLFYSFIFFLPSLSGSINSNEAVIIGQITDEHIEPETPLYLERLKNVLEKMKALSPDLLISTGDHTTYNDAASYTQYSQVFSKIGGFVKFPATFPLDNGIAFVPIAGNHDGWTTNPYDDYRSLRSFVINNYRFVGFSNNLKYDFPYQEIENELKKSCIDGKSIIVFNHYCPHGWISDPNLDINEEVWKRLDGLMQRYPVIAYLAGHNHNNRTEPFSPGYLAHTGGRTGVGALTAVGLSNGKINLFYDLGLYTPLVITEPSQYYPGLDYTKTKKELIKVRAYIRANNSNINYVYYQLDQGNNVYMRRAEETDYYEAELNASSLSGQHTITVTAKNSYGSWADGKQEIAVFFSDSILPRMASACNNFFPSPTATPALILSPKLTPTPTTITESYDESTISNQNLIISTYNLINSYWGYGSPVYFDPAFKGKVDKAEMYAMGNGTLEIKILDPNGLQIGQTAEVNINTSTPRWFTLDFKYEKIITPTNDPSKKHTLTFRAKSGAVTLYRGNSWTWAYKLWLRQCTDGATPINTPVPTTLVSSTPTPTPTPISGNQAPVITAPLSYTGTIGKAFSVTVDGYDLDIGDGLTMKLYNPAPGLTLGYCSQSILDNKKVIKCPYSGIPTTTGQFYGRIILNDGRIQVEKNITTVIN